MNHIEQILRDLDVTSDNASSARWFRLGIRAICALATEARGIGNLMAWGARAERIPAEAGEMAQDFDRELSEADDLLCNHIYTGHQHDKPMTQTQDSRDSAGFPRP